MHTQMMEAFQPNEDVDELKRSIGQSKTVEAELRTEVLNLKSQVQELLEYKEKYLKLKAIFDEMEKDQKYREREYQLLERENMVKIAKLEAEKDIETKRLKEYESNLKQVTQKCSDMEEHLERIKNSPGEGCYDPDNCDDPECFCKYDVQRLLDDNQRFLNELDQITEEKNELVGILHQKDEEVARLQADSDEMKI